MTAPVAATLPAGLVLGHYMPGYTLLHDYARSINPYHPQAEGGEIGGLYRQAPLLGSCWFADPEAPWGTGVAALEAAARYEIRAALDAGINGFVFDYGAGYASFNPSDPHCVHVNLDRISVFFRTAEAEFPDFRLALALDQATLDRRFGRTMDFCINRRVETVLQFLERHADSPNLLRSLDGQPVFTSYRATSLGHDVDSPPTDVRSILGQSKEAIAAWKMVWTQVQDARQSGIFFIADLPNAWQYERDLSYRMPRASVRQLFALWAEAFDGLSHFGVTDTVQEASLCYAESAAIAHAAGRLFVAPVYLGYRQHGDGRILMQGSDLIRETWKLAQQVGADAIQVATWNDYGESTSFIPSIQTGYVPSRLNRYFADCYRGQPRPERETLSLCYRRYPGRPSPTDFPDDAVLWHPLDEEIEAVVIASAPGQLVVAGQGPYEIGRGLSVVRVPLRPGIPSACLSRNGETVVSVTGLAEVIDGVAEPPYRQLLEPYMHSSDFDLLMRRDLGVDFDPQDARWVDSSGSGLADWYELTQAGSRFKCAPKPQPENG